MDPSSFCAWFRPVSVGSKDATKSDRLKMTATLPPHLLQRASLLVRELLPLLVEIARNPGPELLESAGESIPLIEQISTQITT